jgi:SAM-dependent methyltransferase
MNDAASGRSIVPEDAVSNTTRYYKKDFWSNENLKYSQPHYRLEKSARIVRRLVKDKERTILDVGCGPATLRRLLPSNIQYYGIDIAIHDPAPNLLEADIVDGPIRFGDERFDFVLAQGFFEYVGDFQSQKFYEITKILRPNGIFIVSYVNFGHRDREIYWPYSNVQSIDDFRRGLTQYFKIRKFFPTSYNWHHSEPNREPIRSINMHMNVDIPFINKPLAVEYFFICSLRD